MSADILIVGRSPSAVVYQQSVNLLFGWLSAVYGLEKGASIYFLRRCSIPRSERICRIGFASVMWRCCVI